MRGSQNTTFALCVLFSTTGCSLVLCSWLICHLFRSSLRMRRRLFWIQLLALSATGLVGTLVSLLHWLADFLCLLPAAGTPCRVFLSLMVYNEFEACLLEVHIAVGFALAACTQDGPSWLMLASVPLTFPVSGALLFLVEPELAPRHVGDLSICVFCCAPVWAAVVLTCCACASLAYLLGLARILSAGAHELKCRAFMRGVMYLLPFLLTYGPLAFFNFSGLTPPHKEIADPLLLGLLRLNAGLNVVTYWYWLRQADKSEARAEAGTVLTALDEPRATLSTVVAAAVNNHFDIFFDFERHDRALAGAFTMRYRLGGCETSMACPLDTPTCEEASETMVSSPTSTRRVSLGVVDADDMSDC